MSAINIGFQKSWRARERNADYHWGPALAACAGLAELTLLSSFSAETDHNREISRV